MRKINKSKFSLLFDNEKTLSTDELNSIKGGAICGNIPILLVPQAMYIKWFYIGVGETQE